MLSKTTVIIPACNEDAAIGQVVAAVSALGIHEVIVVDDGSEDETARRAKEAGARVISHPYRMGNGAAIKSGARAAGSDILVMMDGDGQHRADQISELLAPIEHGYDLVVGARDDAAQASFMRRLGNRIYNRLASSVTGHPISDLTSGFRAVRRSRFLAILHLLPNGFSYPTTSTMAFFRLGHPVRFVPVRVEARSGKSASHIRLARDGGRFLLIIFRITALYSPLKIFFPSSVAFAAVGAVYYAHTFVTDGRFTNFGMLLFSTSVIIFLMGLLSEQITSLIYSSMQKTDSDS